MDKLPIRKFLLEPLQGNCFKFTIRTREKGILAGILELERIARELGVDISFLGQEGIRLKPGMVIFQGQGSAETVLRSEELLLGVVSKSSGIATAAWEIVQFAQPVKVVCGAWKKLPLSVKESWRRAVVTGGAGVRITEQPFIYLDKNIVRMFGGIVPAVSRAKDFGQGRLVSVQLRGEQLAIAEEAEIAVRAGADILMVDTGNLDDLEAVSTAVQRKGWFPKIQLAFAGGVTLEKLAAAKQLGAGIVDVGRAILDAPLLDITLDVEE